MGSAPASVSEAGESLRARADLEVPDADGVVIGGGCNHSVVDADSEVRHFSFVASASHTQQCRLQAPHLRQMAIVKPSSSRLIPLHFKRESMRGRHGVNSRPTCCILTLTTLSSEPDISMRPVRSNARQ